MMNDYARTMLTTAAVDIYIPHERLDNEVTRHHDDSAGRPKKKQVKRKENKPRPTRKLIMCGRCGNRRIGSLHDCGARKNTWDYCRNKSQWKVDMQDMYRCINIPDAETNERESRLRALRNTKSILPKF